MKQFKDKVAVVTGGGGGIGQALCQELGQGGSIVVVADINDDHARHVASAITQNGGRAHAMHVDVSNEDEVRQLIEETVSEYGRLDYLFNNAGIGIMGDARDLTLEQWRRVIEVNVYGAVYGTTIAYPIMVRQGYGHIVNTASFTGLLPFPGGAPYCASKYAIVGLSLSLRLEGADLGVKISAVCPGYTRTNLYQAMPSVNLPREQVIAQYPFKMMDPSKAARTILRGVLRNQAVIAFPASIRLLWGLYRLFPRLTDRLLLSQIRMLRKFRLNP
jgi:NAD(P)-dependent dehydrogenase (short-subunit alcohol dehydrogenase family)